MEQAIEEKKLTFTCFGESHDAYLYFRKNTKERMPGVIIAPEWWGLNDYTRSRARQIAELGYTTMAMDVYGNGKIADEPDAAGKLASTWYDKPELCKEVVDAALEKFRSLPEVDSTRIALAGYCFGGFVALNAARLGAEVKGVVSFHGGLGGVVPEKGNIKAKLLICHGGADVWENLNVETFKKQMDDAGADYRFIKYPGAKHAFSNPIATAVGKKYNLPIAYNKEADEGSWEEMKVFLKDIFQ